jgi:hypothetical protein
VAALGVCFGSVVSSLDLSDLESLLNDLSVTATNEPAAIGALQMAIQITVMRLEDENVDMNEIRFVLGKVLFNITRNVLITKSSEIFILLLRLAGHFLREIVHPQSHSRTDVTAERSVKMAFRPFDR